MKNTFLQSLIIALFTLIGFFSYGQKNSRVTFYLNAEKIEFKNFYINPKNIDSVSVNKKTETGEIYIKTKKINFLSPEDILKKYSSVRYSSGSVLFRINGKNIDDISVIKVDDSYFIYVDEKKLSETKYLKAKFRDLVIVDISLDTKKRLPEIMIRGKSEILQEERNNLLKENNASK